MPCLPCCKKKETPAPPAPVIEEDSSKKWIKPLTKENILYYYIPLQGLVSYSALSINVLNPALMANIIGPRDITNTLLIHTLVGTSLYVWNRPHLQSLQMKKKAFFSIYNASMFSFGSILTWALLKTLLPDNPAFNTVVALGTAFGLAKIGQDYVAFIDGK